MLEFEFWQIKMSFAASYIEGRNNCVADFLSHFQMDAFRKVLPNANNKMKLVPPNIWDISSRS